MPRELILSLDGKEFGVVLTRIDREDLYGKVEIEAFDEKGKPAALKVLAADGQTLIDKGGTALEVVDHAGNSIDRSELVPVNLEGETIERVPSSFDAPNALRPATIDDYLGSIVKSVYVLDPPDDADLKYLKENLAGKQLFSFPFSYRGGLEYDSAFVLGADDEAFMVICKDTEPKYFKLNQASVLSSDEEQEISADDISFDLL
jgi:hypothetical protein